MGARSLEGILRGVGRDASEFRAIVKVARKQGWTITITNNNHIRFMSPDGSATVIAGMTAGSNAAFSRLKAQLRKAGLVFKK